MSKVARDFFSGLFFFCAGPLCLIYLQISCTDGNAGSFDAYIRQYNSKRTLSCVSVRRMLGHRRGVERCPRGRDNERMEEDFLAVFISAQSNPAGLPPAGPEKTIIKVLSGFHFKFSQVKPSEKRFGEGVGKKRLLFFLK